MIELKEPLTTLWKGKDPFVVVEKLQGEVFRALETRKTLRFSLAEKSYFIKIHYGTTLKEVLKNLISFRIPVLGADREWKAIHRLYQLDVDTMKGIGFGQTGANPLTRKSCIITEDLAPTISLEDYCADWEQTPPDFRIKRMLIKRLATMVRKMHRAGVNHRDCYICHFLLHLPFDGDDEVSVGTADVLAEGGRGRIEPVDDPGAHVSQHRGEGQDHPAFDRGGQFGDEQHDQEDAEDDDETQHAVTHAETRRQCSGGLLASST